MSDHHTTDLDRLLDYLYSGSYSGASIEPASAPVPSNAKNSQETTPFAEVNKSDHDLRVDEEGRSSPLRHARMYAIGDRYDIVHLKDLAKSKFFKAIYREGPGTDTFPELIEYVYTSTPDCDRALRDPMQEICGMGADYLTVRQDVIDIMLDVPTVAVDMCKGLLAWTEWKARSERDHLKRLQSEHSEEKLKLEHSVARNTHRMRNVEAKLEKCQVLVRWLQNRGHRGRASTLSARTDPLTFTEYIDRQAARSN